eukprot:GDKH01017298.1.p2 GENE.GDKH01017298.1~~GDKH01017298.1.p2  ORF type:complete len:159 (-),score=10.48 GDKH01017298.1:517-993(-)
MCEGITDELKLSRTIVAAIGKAGSSNYEELLQSVERLRLTEVNPGDGGPYQHPALCAAVHEKDTFKRWKPPHHPRPSHYPADVVEQGRGCDGCGYVQHRGRECPALRVMCNRCGEKGHFARTCGAPVPRRNVGSEKSAKALRERVAMLEANQDRAWVA